MSVATNPILGIGKTPEYVKEIAASPQIKIVKPVTGSIVSRRREEILKDLDYLETQIGRLAKMARDLRADFLQLTVE